jgi:hypothetical protein
MKENYFMGHAEIQNQLQFTRLRRAYSSEVARLRMLEGHPPQADSTNASAGFAESAEGGQ